MKRITLLLFSMSAFTPVAIAQYINTHHVNPNISRLSPQAFEFAQHGNTPVSYFTGRTNVDIPIHTYRDRDFKIPVSLGYNSSGFVPGNREGIVGLNWFLNAGGVITRKVNGMPDEATGSPSSWSRTLHGQFYGVKNALGIKDMTKSELFNPANGAVNLGWWLVDGCEAEPDDFTFNMPGFAGRFFIENGGSVRTSGNKPFKVDLSSFSVQPVDAGVTVNDSEIVITTDDGYTYYFGGNKQYLEISYPLLDDEIGDNNAGNPVINAWHLSKIEAPNGRTATFTYKTFVGGFSFAATTPNDPVHYLLDVYEVEYSPVTVECSDFSGGMCSYIGATGSTKVTGVTKTVYLEKILIGDHAIHFSYEEKPTKFYTDESSPFNQKNLLLSSVQVKMEGEIVPKKIISLTQQVSGGVHGSRIYLTSLEEAGTGGKYLFDYYKQSEVPGPKTRGVDHWGFWNGGNPNGEFIPQVSYQENGDLIYPPGVRDPNGTKADVGLLKKITYPTGGNTEFIYQPHEYSRRLERRSVNNFLPQLFSVSGNAGGARIWKVIDDDGRGTTTTRQFLYTKNFPSVEQSSGILLSWPRYLFYWEYDDGSMSQQTLYRRSTSYNVNYYPGEQHMQYSEVTEIVNSGAGYVNYKFTSYESNPDYNDYQTAVVTPASQQYIDNVHLYNSFAGIKLNNRSFERGHPLEVSTHASQSGGGYYLVKKTTSLYSSLSDFPDAWAAAVHQTGGIAQSFKKYYYPFLPKIVTEEFYDLSGTHTALVTENTYHSNGYLKTQSVTRSDGKIGLVKYKYPFDYVQDSDDVALFQGGKYETLPENVKAIVDLNKNNILSQPVETIQYLDGKVKGAGLTEYKDIAATNLSKMIYPDKSWALNIEQPLSSFQESMINKSDQWSFVKSADYTPEPEVTYNEYDNFGNLREKIGKDGVKQSFTWSHDKLLPIAELTGAGFDAHFHTSFESNGLSFVSGVTGKTCFEGTSYTIPLELRPVGDDLIMTYWYYDGIWKFQSATTYNPTISKPGATRYDEIRVYPAGSLMTTCTYDPVFGLTSKTDVNGVSMHYEYDIAGRLKTIKDHRGNVLKRFTYHYQPQ